MTAPQHIPPALADAFACAVSRAHESVQAAHAAALEILADACGVRSPAALSGSVRTVGGHYYCLALVDPASHGERITLCLTVTEAAYEQLAASHRADCACGRVECRCVTAQWPTLTELRTASAPLPVRDVHGRRRGTAERSQLDAAEINLSLPSEEINTAAAILRTATARPAEPAA